jgi:pyruvate/2-oxoglutarate dehydrogenase complex dihydrolipoamide dehydrogenase (E3) component
VERDKPDKVIVATGARPAIPEISGIDGPNVVFAEDVLRGRSDTGMNVLVAGGGMVGAETAAYLGVQCKAKVGIIARRSEIGLDMEGGIRDDLKDCLNRCFVEIMTNTRINAITLEGVSITTGGTERFFPCDTVVLAMGTKAYNPLEEELKSLCDVVVVGDALKARKAIDATREGFLAGLNA